MYQSFSFGLIFLHFLFIKNASSKIFFKLFLGNICKEKQNYTIGTLNILDYNLRKCTNRFCWILIFDVLFIKNAGSKMIDKLFVRDICFCQIHNSGFLVIKIAGAKFSKTIFLEDICKRKQNYSHHYTIIPFQIEHLEYHRNIACHCSMLLPINLIVRYFYYMIFNEINKTN